MPATRHRLVVGTVVVPGPDAHLKGADPFTRLVVIGESKDGRLKLARLNGDDGRFWAKVDPAALIRVEV